MEQARQRWLAGQVTSYLWRVRRECFCSGATLDIAVHDGEVVNVTIVDSGQGETQSGAENDAVSVDALFDLIDQRIGLGDDVYAEFDHDLGYPTSVLVVSRMPDAGDQFTVLDFAISDERG